MKKDFKATFINFAKILFLIILCLCIAFAIVWPIWKFSTSFSKIYTIIILSLIGIGLIYLIVSKIKKTPVIKTLQFFSNIILIATGICFSVILLLNSKRLFALFVIIVLILSELLINYLFSKKTNE